jgi:hypothetical protein
MQLIYPNREDRNNRLRANSPRTIPDNTSFVLHAPFGEETILAVFSDAQFENLEREMQRPVPVSREAIQRAASLRGMSVQSSAPSGSSGRIVSSRFNYTILPASFIEETFSYKKPADVSLALRSLRNEILSQGGEFSGNDREGWYSSGGQSGSYRVDADTVTVVIRRPPNQTAAPVTRGTGGPFSFSFDKPPNVSGAVTAVKTAIERKGGIFSGDISAGNFKASGIAGNYRVQDRVSVTIQEKPFVIPNQLIEREVKNYFGMK